MIKSNVEIISSFNGSIELLLESTFSLISLKKEYAASFASIPA